MSRASATRPGPATTLFASSFAGQAAIVVMVPLLTDVAAAFDVSTATAGQSRAVAGVAGGITALALARVAGRHRLEAVLQAGLVLLMAGSATTAAAPTFAVVLTAQVAIGAGIALVLSASFAAAAEWPPTEDRARVLTLTIVGPAASWIVGLPLVGLLSDLGWRVGLLVPLAAAAAALTLVSMHVVAPAPVPPRRRGILDDMGLAPWAVAELLGAAGWAGGSVYSGALIVESYGVSTSTAAIVLAITAVAYLPGAFVAKRWIEGRWRVPLIATLVALALLTVVTYAVRPGILFTTVVLSALVFLAGARTTAGAAYGLRASPGRKVGVTSIRAASAQFGYLLGAAVGGLGLAVWGYSGAGVLLAALFVLAAAIHVAVLDAERRLRLPRAVAVARG